MDEDRKILVSLEESCGKEKLTVTVEIEERIYDKMIEMYNKSPDKWERPNCWALFQAAKKGVTSTE